MKSKSAGQVPGDNGAMGLEFLTILEYAILRRVKPMSYEYYGHVPAFYSKIFPSPEKGVPCPMPWNHSFMLEYFLLDAEDFFSQPHMVGEKINSGIWLETIEKTGEEIPLIAKAWQLSNEQVITIQVIHEEYAERLRILRKARIELIERRKISDSLNSFKKKALFDAMTKLYNKGSFMDILQEQVEKFSTYAPSMALFIIDVDHFKDVNDTMGHLAGDSILVQVADCLRNSLRKNDFPARYGGDEFTIIAPDTNMEQSQKLAEKLRARIEAHDFNTEGPKVTISVGYTIYRPGETVQNFIRRADRALYDAKQQGRNRACFRDPWLIDDEEEEGENGARPQRTFGTAHDENEGDVLPGITEDELARKLEGLKGQTVNYSDMDQADEPFMEGDPDEKS
ncbi:MAG: GGDEF domain-containing protein [Deltaproteobacteria bacterium]|nr:GGDEF domain-containing protein [Deltaproteobacteria bacterium]